MHRDLLAVNTILPTTTIRAAGDLVMPCLLVVACLLGVSALVNLVRSRSTWERPTRVLLVLANLVFIAGFLWICWFHYQIYSSFTLEVPEPWAPMINQRFEKMNRGSDYGLPLYDAGNPPRYAIPVWIESEKYYFWFMCYGVLLLVAQRRIENHRARALLHLLLALKACFLFLAADPFHDPLPMFSEEVGPWFEVGPSPMERIGLFFRLYPKMIFYYNATYMWFHPPMLFLAYACITVTFVTSVFVLVMKSQALEVTGYDFAKLGYFLLTLGTLLGYPWALQAWGPNWWWDPKVCSSIMMWCIFSAYMHTRLYAYKRGMLYFTAFLGILSFAAMVFTFLTSFYFPGQHTMQ